MYSQFTLPNKLQPMRIFTWVQLVFVLVLPNKLLAQQAATRTSQFDSQWFKSIVSIEIPVGTNGYGQPIGTGFLVKTPKNHNALVTAKHVVFTEGGTGPLRTSLSYRLNNRSTSSTLITDSYATRLTSSGWFASTNSDLACRIVVWGNDADILSIPLSEFLDPSYIEAGAPVCVMGYPLGLRSQEYALPILRRGIVARSGGAGILLDCFVFPGNSGGPVVYEPAFRLGPDFASPLIQGTKLLGVVSSYVPYIEPAISPQTGRARVIFEENTGLCNVEGCDKIRSLLGLPEFVAKDNAL